MKNIPINRAWCMPSIWTFEMPPVKRIFGKYDVGKKWVDPFSGIYSPAEYTNDIEGRGAKSKKDGLIFLKSLPDNTFNGALFDPPYSVEQCLRNYSPKNDGTAGRAEYWSKCKDQIARIIRPGGRVISFGWDSTGLGKRRGFEIIEILLLCHGALHNDTIITCEFKVNKSINGNSYNLGGDYEQYLP